MPFVAQYTTCGDGAALRIVIASAAAIHQRIDGKRSRMEKGVGESQLVLDSPVKYSQKNTAPE